MPVTIAELARHLSAEVRGDAAHQIRGVASLAGAGPDDLSFVADDAHASLLDRCRAGAVLMRPAHADRCRGTALLVGNPHLAFARAASLLYPPSTPAPGTDARACVAEGARIDPTAAIAAGSVIEAGAEIGKGCVIGPLCHVEQGAVIGDGTRLVSRVFIGARSVIGRNCLLHPGAVIGSDGFGLARDGARWVKVPQLGRVRIGDDVEVGANTTIDRGALDDTVIGNGAKLDNLIQVAHNVHIGDDTAIAAQVGIAGSAIIGKRCTLGGQAGIIGHLEITDDVHITATSLVTNSIPESGTYASNLKAEAIGQWRRTVARLGRIEEMARRLKQAEDEIRKLKGEVRT